MLDKAHQRTLDVDNILECTASRCSQHELLDELNNDIIF